MTIVVGILLLLAAASFATDLIFQNSRRLTSSAPVRRPKRMKAQPDVAVRVPRRRLSGSIYGRAPGRPILRVHLRGSHARSR
jgi:hypothetical protein